MNIILSTNRCAGFSRIKIFACILAALFLGDILFRSSEGLKSIAHLKKIVVPAAVTNPPVAASIPVLRMKERTNTPQQAVPEPKLSAANKTARKKQSPRVGDGGEAGGLFRATPDEKELAPISFPPDARPRMTNPPPAATHIPLPIALPK